MRSSSARSLHLTELDGEPVRRRDSPAGHRVRRAAAVAPDSCSPPATTAYGEPSKRPRIRCSARTTSCTASWSVFWQGAPPDGTELMHARVWGCRGSIAAPGEDTVRYGGNTSCVEVRLESGHVARARRRYRHAPARRRARRARRRPSFTSSSPTCTWITCRVSGFFRPLFQPGVDVHIWGPPSPVQTLAERIAIYLSPPLFPVRLADVAASVTFHDADESGATIGSAVDPRRPRHAPGPDGRIPHRGGEPVARLPPRPRAGHRRDPRGAAGALDERLRHRA